MVEKRYAEHELAKKYICHSRKADGYALEKKEQKAENISGR